MVDDDIERVGIVGIGDIGFPIAETLLDSGYSVTAFDVRREALDEFEAIGGDTASDPAAVARRCQSVHVVVVTERQVEDVIFGDSGIVEGFSHDDTGGVVAIHSSIDPEFVRECADRSPRDVAVIDAAVSGGTFRAEEGDLTLMVGGPEEAVTGYTPVLDSLAREVHHLGPVGSGLVAKLTNNSIVYTAWAATLEALKVGREHGLDEEQLVEIYQQSTASNHFVDNYEHYVETRPRELPGGPDQAIRNSMEVITNYTEMARERGVPIPIMETVEERYADLMNEFTEDALND